MISERLLKARDLVTRCEYESVDGKRRIKARVCSSRSLGLEEREELSSQTATPPEAAAPQESEPRGYRKNRRSAQEAEEEKE